MPNAFTTLIGIEMPIVQAAMGGATSPQLAAAVSNAGGLGMLALPGVRPMQCAPKTGQRER
jgi:nitronate monooxygenase